MNPEDHNITLITHWLTGRIEQRELQEGLTSEGLSEEPAEAVKELLAELGRPEASRAHLQMVAREALEALAVG
jgi:hypothetical protein